MTPRVYLCGPISGLDYDDSTTWRNQAATVLAEAGITAYSPMRAKEMTRAWGEKITPARSMAGEHPLLTSKGIMCRDYTDCTRADALLVNFLGAQTVSLGSIMELAWAFHLHIPVVCAGEADNINVAHPMAHEAINFRVDTLSEGIDLIKTILLPEVRGE
jgi:nucleoside 2-deoxyribosyltransferase